MDWRATGAQEDPNGAQERTRHGLVYGGARVGLWDWSLASDTVAWIILTGLGLFGASVSVFTRAGSFKRTLLGALGITVFAEVFVNLYVFPLLVELVLAPVLVCLAATSFVVGGKPGLDLIKKAADGLLAVVGFAMIIIVGIRLVREWDDFRQTQGWQRFALPVWLTVGAMDWERHGLSFAALANAIRMDLWPCDARS